jgi:Mg2+/Co2+ transporter CorB
VTPTSSVAGTTVTNIATLTAVNQLNLLTSPFTTVSINIPGNSVINNSTSNLNAETNKIPLQHTGVPIAGFILAILMIVSGSIIPKLKK